jgi:hypothetical protein
MSTIEDELNAANVAIQSSNQSLIDLEKQIIELNSYVDSINTTVSTPNNIVAAVNTDIFYIYSQSGVINANTANGGFVFPTGTTQERPTRPIKGTVRYNTNSSSLEIYTTRWQDVGVGAGGSGGGAVSGVFYENSNTVTESFTSTPGKNIQSAGPLTLELEDVTITIANGSVWTVV